MSLNQEIKAIKIAVYTGGLNYSVSKGILSLLNEKEHREIRVFLNHRNPTLRKKISLQLANFKKNKHFRLWEVLSILANKVYSKVFARQYRKFGCDVVPNYVDLVRNHKHITIENVWDINASYSIAAINKFQPDLGVSIAAPILKKQVIEIAKLGNLNLHKGKLPEYRGMPPAFWELWNKEVSVGCSVHIVNEVLDAGDIVQECAVPIYKWSTPKGLQIKLDEVGVKLMSTAVEEALNNTMELKPQVGSGNTNTKPTLKQNLQLQQQALAKTKTNILKEFIKTTIFTFYNIVVAPLRAYFKGLFGKQDIIVLLYHRINDFQRDSLTVGVEQFDQQMQYINERFPVASLKSLIDGKVSRFEKKPIIIVSFDDGYSDNYENAFPVCLRNKIPCSFFVSTEMIHTGTPFPHDAKFEDNLQNMNWKQLREMKGGGMYIGSHTCTHIDCSKESTETLEREFSDSQTLLDKELGKDIAILAYPFGGKHQFTEQAKKVAIKEGYSAVLSAYGGINKDLDLFDVKRGGIDWNYSHQAFKARLLGWKQ